MGAKRRRKRKFKINRKRLYAVMGVLAGVAALICAVAAIVSGASRPVKLKELPFSAAQKHVYTGEGFYYTDGASLAYVNKAKLNKPVTRTISTSDIDIAASPSFALLYNRSALHVVSAADPIEISCAIETVKCGAQHFAALCEEADGTETLKVYNMRGDMVDELMFRSGYLVDYGFETRGGETLWTLELNTSATLPRMTITTYDMQRHATTGMISIQNMIAENIVFSQKGLFVVGTSGIIRYDRATNTEKYRAMCYGRRLIDSSTQCSKPLFIFAERGAPEKGGTVFLYSLADDDVADTAIHALQLPENALGAFAMKGRLVIVTPEGVTYYTATGKKDGYRAFDAPVTGVERLDEKTLLVERAGMLYTMNAG